ncbi:MAG: hypothetical protein IKO35_01320 [Elusimicrobiaceae bacterium]|nr:hypothetical protein [Elusimicrobiaceae bacterium]
MPIRAKNAWLYRLRNNVLFLEEVSGSSPFRLAKVGYERIQETADPSKALDRARSHWKAQGRSRKWIQQRMMGQETRNKLTDYWQAHGVTKSDDFAMLTNVIHQEWSDLSVAQHISAERYPLLFLYLPRANGLVFFRHGALRGIR